MSVLKTTTYDPPRTDGFAFTPENKAKADAYRTRYPEDRQASAVLWLLYLAQEQNGGWLANDAIEYVAAELDMDVAYARANGSRRLIGFGNVLLDP